MILVGGKSFMKSKENIVGKIQTQTFKDRHKVFSKSYDFHFGSIFGEVNDQNHAHMCIQPYGILVFICIVVVLIFLTLTMNESWLPLFLLFSHSIPPEKPA